MFLLTAPVHESFGEWPAGCVAVITGQQPFERPLLLRLAIIVPGKPLPAKNIVYRGKVFRLGAPVTFPPCILQLPFFIAPLRHGFRSCGEASAAFRTLVCATTSGEPASMILSVGNLSIQLLNSFAPHRTAKALVS